MNAKAKSSRKRMQSRVKQRAPKSMRTGIKNKLMVKRLKASGSVIEKPKAAALVAPKKNSISSMIRSVFRRAGSRGG